MIKIVTCHIGNGSSISAVKNGKCVDTTMGFTPLAGVPMGTRSGDIDPAILQFVMNKEGIDIDKIMEAANRDNIFGRPVTRDEFYFSGTNMGFENHCNISCTLEIKNYNSFLINLIKLILNG